MTEPNDSWNPDDGPRPSDDERDDARSLASALDARTHRRGQNPELDALVDVALRAHATAHPSVDLSRDVATRAVQYVLSRADSAWMQPRWRWATIAAIAVVGLVGIEFAQFLPRHEAMAPISKPAIDVLRSPLPDQPRSAPIDRITETRMRAYRDALIGSASRGDAP